MKCKEILAVLLVLMLMFSAGCSTALDDTSSTPSVTGETPTGSKEDTLALAYSSTDSLDPYAAVTRYNQELCGLLYDSLVVVDDAFAPVYRLAESIEREEERFTVTIKSATFSDGTAVTAEDVEYSLSKALNSETKYKAQLDSIYSYSAADSRTLEITIDESDPYFENLLDFPILKKDSDQQKNEDGKVLPPIGSGRYVFRDGRLEANPGYVGGSMNLQTIELVDTPDADAFDHNLEMGNIHMSFSDLSDNVPLKMTGQSLSVQLNNLVYLGLNFNDPYLSDPRFRQAISLALNREKIASDSYFDYATPAAGPFPTNWAPANGLQTIASTENTQRAVALLNEIGYNSKDEDGYLLDGSGKRIELTLLCNLDNTARTRAAQQIKSQLSAIGIFTHVRTVNWTAYQSELASLSFDLYIGEVRLKNNMDLSAFVTEKSGASFGYVATKTEKKDPDADDDEDEDADEDKNEDADEPVDTSGTTAYITVSAKDMVEDYFDGKATVADVTAAFNAELPIIPLVHRMGQVAYSSDLSTGPASLPGDLWNGIENLAF